MRGRKAIAIAAIYVRALPDVPDAVETDSADNHQAFDDELPDVGDASKDESV